MCIMKNYMKQLGSIPLIILLSLVCFQEGWAQKIVTRTGHIWFESHTPLEDIEAHTYQAMSVLNSENGELAFAVLIKGFQFEKALMQEHFNEKYMESDTYPKATFAGTLSNFSEINLGQDGTYPAHASGTLTIHGVKQAVEADGEISVQGDQLTLTSEFTVEVADYEIKIPSVVRDNIAKTITIFVDIPFESNSR